MPNTEQCILEALKMDLALDELIEWLDALADLDSPPSWYELGWQGPEVVAMAQEKWRQTKESLTHLQTCGMDVNKAQAFKDLDAGLTLLQPGNIPEAVRLGGLANQLLLRDIPMALQARARA